MNEEKEKWIEEVFQSMKGSKRAKPQLELFTRIENKIALSKAKIVSLHQWRYAAVTAALILLINTTALMYYNQHKQMNNEDMAVVDTYNISLISAYQIYE